MKKHLPWLVCVAVTCLTTASVQSQTTIDRERLNRLKLISQTVSQEIPLVIAHRGASGYLPEHTTEAAAFAHALGADYIEQDVVLSKDGIPVVLHDVTLDAVTNVIDTFPDRIRDGHFYVFDFTLAELRSLNVHERMKDRQRFPANKGRFRIGTLDEHLQLIQGLNVSRKRNVGVYVEIKSPAKHRQQSLDPSIAVLKTLAAYGYTSAEDRAFIQCFDSAEILRLRTELKCRLPLIQLLSDAPSAKQTEEISKVADGIGIAVSAVISQADGQSRPVISDVVKLAHQHALMVHVWTFRTDDLPTFAESPAMLLDLLVKDAGVDGIFTDQADSVLKWRSVASRHLKLRGPFHLLND